MIDRGHRPPAPARVLVAGIGNLFLGDDAFGVEVAQRLLRRRLPDGVRVVDFGIRGFDLAFALQDDYGAVILVDALPRGEPPGTLTLLEPDLAEWAELGLGDDPEMAVETHAMDPVKVLRLARTMGGLADSSTRLLVVGCEPAEYGEDEDGNIGLSAPVAAVVEEAIAMVESLVEALLCEDKPGVGSAPAPVGQEVSQASGQE
ncbi:MAG: hydrogenase maturation protease, partial [Chloroflexota bacterium]|nr:hydrogenase maturation protease [Chloroflexota bacterium]